MQAPHPLFVGGLLAPSTVSSALTSAKPQAHLAHCAVVCDLWMSIKPLRWHMAKTKLFIFSQKLCPTSGSGTTIYPGAWTRLSGATCDSPPVLLSCAGVHAPTLQSHLTFCDPMNCSLLGSSVHGILQARILEWVAMLFSKGSSQPGNRTHISCTAGRFFTH